jgi:hypothetical protein
VIEEQEEHKHEPRAAESSDQSDAHALVARDTSIGVAAVVLARTHGAIRALVVRGAHGERRRDGRPNAPRPNHLRTAQYEQRLRTRTPVITVDGNCGRRETAHRTIGGRWAQDARAPIRVAAIIVVARIASAVGRRRAACR